MAATRSLGYGLAILLIGGAVAKGQFAVDRPSSPPAPRPLPTVPSATGFQPASPVGFQPASPGTQGVMPAGGIPRTSQPRVPSEPAPLDVLVPSTLTNHPLALKPEHGAYVICVRSYSRPAWVTNGPTALSLAEAMANEIRSVPKAPAYLFEHVSEEKKAEFARREAARKEQEPFLKALELQRQRAIAQGSTFLEPERGVDVIRYKTVRYNDQYAVIIAGFRTDADARKALDIIRKWPIPKNKSLLDASDIQKTGADGKPVIEQSFLNPYAQAFVTPNPTIPRTTPAPTSGVDEFTAKLNEGRPYSLLKAKKPWTLAVKQFSAPASITSVGSSTKSTGSSNGADVLDAGAEMAEQLARMLRGMKDKDGRDVSFEAFVLHTRVGTLVTVGQFDGPDDPALLEMRRKLTNMNFTMSEQANVPGRPLSQQDRLFSDNILPIPIPR